MGWIGDLINVIRGAETLDFILTDPLPLAQKDGKVIAPQPSSLLPDDCYIELFVESMWLPKARRLTSLYHGVVHAYTALERVGEGKAEFAFISTPTELAKVDPRSQGKVVTR